MSEWLLEVENLAIGFEDRTIATEIDLRLGPSQAALVAGHNGTGKTTLLRTLFGLLPPLAGNGHVLGRELGSLSPRELVRRGARLLGQGVRGFPGLSVRGSQRVLADLYGFPVVQPLPNPELPPGRRVGDLSVGQRRLEAVNLLRPGSPCLFLLDEPIGSVDWRFAEEISSWIALEKSRGVGFLVVEHRLGALEGLFDFTLTFGSTV